MDSGVKAGNIDLERIRGAFAGLMFEQPIPGVLNVIFDRPGKLNALSESMHADLVSMWPALDKDSSVKVVVLSGASGAFSAGGDLEWVDRIAADYDARLRAHQDARELVHNIVNFSKPVISAVEGPAVGAALAAALLSDISIAGRSAKLVDGHTRLGVAAGDHATILWPLLCGMAKAKYYLMLCKPISGEEAERIGLITKVVDDGTALEHALKAAGEMLNQSQTAVRWTKLALNMWIKQAAPIFEASVSLEFLGMGGPDLVEGVRAIREKRRPNFGTTDAKP